MEAAAVEPVDYRSWPAPQYMASWNPPALRDGANRPGRPERQRVVAPRSIGVLIPPAGAVKFHLPRNRVGDVSLADDDGSNIGNHVRSWVPSTVVIEVWPRYRRRTGNLRNHGHLGHGPTAAMNDPVTQPRHGPMFHRDTGLLDDCRNRDLRYWGGRDRVVAARAACTRHFNQLRAGRAIGRRRRGREYPRQTNQQAEQER